MGTMFRCAAESLGTLLTTESGWLVMVGASPTMEQQQRPKGRRACCPQQRPKQLHLSVEQGLDQVLLQGARHFRQSKVYREARILAVPVLKRSFQVSELARRGTRCVDSVKMVHCRHASLLQ